jgi:hypothetical protein
MWGIFKKATSFTLPMAHTNCWKNSYVIHNIVFLSSTWYITQRLIEGGGGTIHIRIQANKTNVKNNGILSSTWYITQRLIQEGWGTIHIRIQANKTNVKNNGISLPISTATLTRAGRDACKQTAATKLLLNVGIKGTFLLPLLQLPQNMVALFCFLCCGSCTFCLLPLA